MLKKLFLIGGMSESGKSTVGRYLDAKGIKRLKILTFLKSVMEIEGIENDFQQWNDVTEKQRPDWLAERFVEELKLYCRKQRIVYCCLESLYRPAFGEFIRSSLPGRVVIVYVDIPLEIRLHRQVIRENLPSLEKAREYLLPRDKKKEEWGTHLIKEIADVMIDNSHSIEHLHHQIDMMLFNQKIPKKI